MASIVKARSGNWQVQIRIKGWPTQRKTFRIKRDAEAWARTTEDEITRGIFIARNESESMTISEALDKYLSEVTPTKKAETQKREIGRSKLLKEKLGKYSLASLNSKTISQFRDDRIKDGKSNNTVRLDLALLSHLYTTAMKEWQLGLAMNPVANVRKPSPGKGRTRRLSGDEEDRLFRACRAHSNPFLIWIVKLALYTAMRQGEILSLTRDQINLKKRTIFLPDTKNDTVRTVPLFKKAHEVILEVLEHPVRPKDTDLLFFGEPGKDGQRKPYTINRVWSNALIRAEMEDFRFHDLRHEATSRLVEAGLTDQQVSSITGHKSMQMLKRYTHLRNEDLVKILDERL